MWKVTCNYHDDKRQLKVGTVSFTYQYDDGKTPDFNWISPSVNLCVCKDMQTLTAAKLAIAKGAPTMVVEYRGADAVRVSDGKVSGAAVAAMVRVEELPVPEKLDAMDDAVLADLKAMAEAEKLKHEKEQYTLAAIEADGKLITDIMNGGK